MVKEGDGLLLGLSGGPDSVCLFDILDTLKDELKFELAVAHYNHRQRGEESDADEKFVISLAKSRGVRCFIGQNKSTRKISEDEARNLRYAFLGKSLGEWSGDVLVLAHNQNDLAETLLLNLIRGAGILGLSSIPLRRKKIIRPLLKFGRQEVLEHLLTQKIKYRLDSSNENLNFSRNRIRNKVIPELQTINKQATANIFKAAEHLSSESALLFELMEKELKMVLISKNKNRFELDVRKIQDLSPSLITALIRYILFGLSLNKDVSSKHYLAIYQMIIKNIGNKKITPNKNLLVSLNKGIIRIERIIN